MSPPFLSRALPAAVLAIGGLLLPGCQQTSTRTTAEGHTSFAFVEAPAIGGRQRSLELANERDAVDVLDAARPVEPLALPHYPPQALRGGAGLMLVGVRIEVDADGRVTEIEPSLASFSTPGPYAEQFRAAVDAAVWQWRFRPARRRHLEPVKLGDGSVYWRASNETNVATALDLAVTFQASGEVVAARAR
jgi:hypothetical protein